MSTYYGVGTKTWKQDHPKKAVRKSNRHRRDRDESQIFTSDPIWQCPSCQKLHPSSVFVFESGYGLSRLVCRNCMFEGQIQRDREREAIEKDQ